MNINRGNWINRMNVLAMNVFGIGVIEITVIGINGFGMNVIFANVYFCKNFHIICCIQKSLHKKFQELQKGVITINIYLNKTGEMQ